MYQVKSSYYYEHRIVIDNERCVKCYRCIRKCPQHVFGTRDKKVMLHNPGRCSGCLYCTTLCPTKALSFTTHPTEYAIRAGIAKGTDMCFRPTQVSADAVPVCPKCNQEIRLAPGVIIDNCPFCQYKFTEEEKAAAMPSAAGAPGAPSAPKAPGAPKPPAKPES